MSARCFRRPLASLVAPISLLAILFPAILFLGAPVVRADEPRALDDALELTLFASEPEIVTPVALDVDDRGRVWVIESNTHQTPAGYERHPSDRIWIFNDVDGDGRADERRLFFDGFRHGMGLVWRGPRSIWLVTRREVMELVDADGDDTCDDARRVLELETEGDYPHNGLSGLAFDALGRLYVGTGENLGVPYRLVGAASDPIPGGGEGGNVFRLRADGSGLERWATGFWNAFGLEFDGEGRLFVVDNDPDSRPPCRLLHVVRGGDYGYRFWLGRKGLHPFTSWNGALPGTLPMAAGTGEAPSDIVAYEHDAFPRRYHGQLIGSSWGDHRLELFSLAPRGASVSSHAVPIVQGGEDFRPVGLAVGPDGSVWFSDWVKADYPVHGRGRLWRLAPKDPARRRVDPAGVGRASRRAREAATGLLLSTERGLEMARELFEMPFAGDAWSRRARRQAAIALARAGRLRPADLRTDLALLPQLVADSRPDDPDLDAALAALASREDAEPAVRVQALVALRAACEIDALAVWAGANDPFIASGALFASRLLEPTRWLTALDAADARERLGSLLAWRRSSGPGRSFAPFPGPRFDVGDALIRRFLDDPDAAVRRAAVQWIGEERREGLRDALDDVVRAGPQPVEILDAYLAARALLDGENPHDRDRSPRGEMLLAWARNRELDEGIRAWALRSVSGIDPETARALLDDPALRSDVLRVVARLAAEWGDDLLAPIARNGTIAERRIGIAGLAVRAERHRDLLASLLDDDEELVRREASRALRGVEVDVAARERIAAIEAAASLPAPERGTEEWRRFVLNGGDPAEGEITFFHPSGPRCVRCHAVGGLGGDVGPELSTIGRRPLETILLSLLEPSREIAPQFEPWTVVLGSGEVVGGVRLGESAAGHWRIGTPDGDVREIAKGDVLDMEPQTTSVMPAGLVDTMTDREVRDLLAYLASLRG